MIVQLISLALVVSVNMGEQYKFEFTERGGMKSPSIAMKDDDASLSTRMLQADSSADSCYLSNDKIACVYSFVAGSAGNETMIEFMAECDIGPYGFDFRRASNCACLAHVSPAHGTMKQCPCTVCAVDLGETPVSVDCSVHEKPATIVTPSRADNITDDDLTGSAASIDDSVSIPADNVTAINITGGQVNIAASTEASVDPFIFATCSSFDCFFACNGTCSLNCDDPSGNVCPFCETYTGSGATTSAPTGNQIGGLGAPPQSAPSIVPTSLPSSLPTTGPSSLPSEFPTSLPSSLPTTGPSSLPSEFPTSLPSSLPSPEPSSMPSALPTELPSSIPTSDASSRGVTTGLLVMATVVTISALWI